jgi:uncharacterized protein
MGHTCKRIPLCSLLAAMLLVGHLCLAADAPKANYAGVAEPQVKPALLQLPPGAVEPRGWLRDWAIAAKDGMTGHIDEYFAPFHEDWRGPAKYHPDDRPDSVVGLGPETGYWLDGLLGLAYMLHDDALIKKVSERLNIVVEGVNKGEASFSFWTKDKPKGNYNNFGLAQMGRALVGYYQATGDKRILDALVKVYSEFPMPMGHLAFKGDITGLQNLEPLLEAYRLSGDPRLLEQAKKAMETPEIQATVRDWAEGRYVIGHGVCAHDQVRLPAIYSLWTGDNQYRQASYKAYEWMCTEHMQPHGLTSAEEFFSGVGAFRLTETCDISFHLWSSAWMYRIFGDRLYGDRMERALFNAGPAPIARDFKSACYTQSPNRIQFGSLPAGWCIQVSQFVPVMFPPCCHGALNRIIPSYVRHMWMATYDGGLAAALYGPCTVSAMVGEQIPVKISCDTAYPFEENIRFSVDPKCEAKFPLYFRMPRWCAKPEISVNGSAVDATPDASGFVRIERTWKRGDVVSLKLPMAVTVACGYEREYPESTLDYYKGRPSANFKKRRLPYETVSYGPLLFALPIPDIDPNTPVAGANVYVNWGAKWQYALDNDAAQKGKDIEVERKPMPSRWDWPLAAPIVLKVAAREFDWHPAENQALPKTVVKGTKAAQIELIPYGCTKFRISMFPVTAKAWEQCTKGDSVP